MEWILILFIHTVVTQSEAVSVTHIDGFKSLQECTVAGEQSKQLGKGTLKKAVYVCVTRSKG